MSGEDAAPSGAVSPKLRSRSKSPMARIPVPKPGSKLDSSEANCVANCAGRFLDSSVFVVNRMMQKRQGPQ